MARAPKRFTGLKAELIQLGIEGVRLWGSFQTRYIPKYCEFLVGFLDQPELRSDRVLLKMRINRERQEIEAAVLETCAGEISVASLRTLHSALNGLARRAPKEIRALVKYNPDKRSLNKILKDNRAGKVSPTDLDAQKVFWRNKVRGCLAGIGEKHPDVQEAVRQALDDLMNS